MGAQVSLPMYQMMGWTGSIPVKVAATTDGYVKVDIQNTSIAVTCDQLPAALGQSNMAGSLSVTVASDQSALAVTVPKPEYSKAIAPVLHNFAVTGITASAYTELITSTSAKALRWQFANTSGSFLTLATGAAASEVPFAIIPPGGTAEIEISIAASTRLSVTSDENVAVGKFSISAFV